MGTSKSSGGEEVRLSHTERTMRARAWCCGLQEPQKERVFVADGGWRQEKYECPRLSDRLNVTQRCRAHDKKRLWLEASLRGQVVAAEGEMRAKKRQSVTEWYVGRASEPCLALTGARATAFRSSNAVFVRGCFGLAVSKDGV